MESRQNFDLFEKYGWMNFKDKPWRYMPWKLVFFDTITPLICKVRGHIWIHNKKDNYTYCRRCCRLKD
jgi:hypothetical protein